MPNPLLLIVVEDEPIVLMDTEQVLQNAGFDVIVASEGEAALAALDDEDNVPVGIVTDIRLGKDINGWEVARHAREKHPAIGLIYMTADSAVDWTAYGVPKSALVPKPIAGAQLVTAVANLLDDKAGAVEMG
ncbi:response regulator [Sphingomonas sp. DT-51]|uniref:response regulator n=1 Tax=Sphingomonas sp. DT-51 TaxID=3396165 RepID=UPI003F1DB645